VRKKSEPKLPPANHKGAGAPGSLKPNIAPDEKIVDWSKCPAGHKLPKSWKDKAGGVVQCTPRRCAAGGNKAKNGAALAALREERNMKNAANLGDKAVRQAAGQPKGVMVKVSARNQVDHQLPKLAPPLVIVAPIEESLKPLTEGELKGLKDLGEAGEMSTTALPEQDEDDEAREERKKQERRARLNLQGNLISQRLRNQLVPMPAGLKGGDAEKYGADKLVEMIPLAVQEIEYRLRFGDDDARNDAARDVLDANGLRRKEALQVGAPTIVLNFGEAQAGGHSFPFLKRSNDAKEPAGTSTGSEGNQGSVGGALQP